MTEGHILLKKGNKNRLWDGIEFYYKAVKLKPSLGEPHYYIGQSYQKIGTTDFDLIIESYQNAFDYYAKLTKDGTAEPTFLGYMGKCLFELGHIEDGITLCEEAISMDSKCETAYFQLAEIMKYNKDPEAVISYYYKNYQKKLKHYLLRYKFLLE